MGCAIRRFTQGCSGAKGDEYIYRGNDAVVVEAGVLMTGRRLAGGFVSGRDSQDRGAARRDLARLLIHDWFT